MDNTGATGPAPAQPQPTGHGGQPLQRPDNPQTDPAAPPKTVQRPEPEKSPVPNA